MRFALVLRTVSVGFRIAVIVPAAGIVRDAIEDFETDVRMIERDAAKLGEIARADPDLEASLVHGFGRNVSNPQIDDL